ncbi:MAG: hypothetical protein A4E55_00295 [Pelotomaculum sp. PtaU1.Bin035]|nr:MAG: hypothetical protein A4E55_00295 [Pelotomaculum sp. PtaU1.Bin035]
MIEKFAVEIILPALGKSMEFLLPSVMEISTAQSLIQKIVTLQHPEMRELDNKNNMWLVDIESKRRIPANVTCREGGLKNGSKLMLLWVN